jgi:hypothetical protein
LSTPFDRFVCSPNKTISRYCMFWILLLSFIVILKFVDQYILSPLAVYLDGEKLIEHVVRSLHYPIVWCPFHASSQMCCRFTF